jgi:hypothetical protein
METEFDKQPEKVEKEAGYIKLMKSATSKGVVSYSWDIKVVEGRSKEDYEALINIISELNERMNNTFN